MISMLQLWELDFKLLPAAWTLASPSLDTLGTNPPEPGSLEELQIPTEVEKHNAWTSFLLTLPNALA